jgi:hypothetical protein
MIISVVIHGSTFKPLPNGLFRIVLFFSTSGVIEYEVGTIPQRADVNEFKKWFFRLHFGKSCPASEGV